MTIKIIAKIKDNRIVKLIEPRVIAQRDAYKISNDCDISKFPVGSVVEIVLISRPGSKDKLADVLGFHNSMEENKEIENVINITDRREKKEINLTSFRDGLHFYLVFNPLFNHANKEKYEGDTQAHSFFNLLRNNQKKNPGSYLYWGKLKSTERREPLQLDNYISAIQNNVKNSKDTYLFISDFTFFWVAKVECVSFDISKGEIVENSIEFYKDNYERVEAWFKIVDMTILSNASSETLKLISNLYISTKNDFNSRIDSDKEIEISPYLSGLRYPLIIEDRRKEVYFTDDLETQKENPLLGDKTTTKQTKERIYGYVIPDLVFNSLSTSVQREIINAEMMYVNLGYTTNHDIYAKDYDVARKYLIILEKVINDTLLKLNLPKNSRIVLSKTSNLSLRDIEYLFKDGEFDFLRNDNKRLYYALKSLYKNNKIKAFNNVRNSSVHMKDETFSHDVLINIRREILGVGKVGYINTLTIAVNPSVKYKFSINESFDKVG